MLHTQLKCIAALLPPQIALRIGAPLWVDEDLNADTIIAVAQDDCSEVTIAQSGKNYDVVSPWLWNCRTNQPFFHMRNPVQSGFFSTESLKHFYRNVRLKENVEVETTTLSEVLSAKVSQFCDIADINWISIGDLWSAKILFGVKDFIKNLDVAVVKAPIRSIGISDFDVCTAEAIDKLLADYGLSRSASISERHSDFAQLLYVRDWKAQANNQNNVFAKERDLLTRDLSSHQNTIVELHNEIDLQYADVDALHEKAKSLTGQLEQKNSEFEQIKKQLANQEEATSRLEADLLSRIQSQENELKSVKNENASLQDRLFNKAEELKSVQLESAERLAHVRSLESDKATIATGFDELKRAIESSAQTSIKTISTKSVDLLDAFNEVIQSLVGKSAEQHSQLVERLTVLSDQQPGIHDVEKLLTDLQNALTHERSKDTALKHAELTDKLSTLAEQQLVTRDVKKLLTNLQNTLTRERSEDAAIKHEELSDKLTTLAEQQLVTRDVKKLLTNLQNTLTRERSEDAAIKHKELSEKLTTLADLQLGTHDVENTLRKVWDAQAIGRSNEADISHTKVLESLEFLTNDQKTALNQLNYIGSLLRKNHHTQFASLSGKKDQIDTRLLQYAEDSFRREDYRAAAEAFGLLHDRRPKDAWNVQGIAESLSRFEGKLDNFTFPLDRLADIHSAGRWDVVVRLYRKALSLNPNISRLWSKGHPLKTELLPKNSDCDPVFIIGCGHSGTSIMLRILGEHPDLWPIEQESALFLRSDENVHRAMADWDKKCLESQATRWIEKTPPHIFQMDRFLALRPGAQFILMLRDGRDVVASLRQRKGYEGIEDRIDRWIYDNKAGLPFWGHPQVKVVKYEEFVERPDITLSEICEFLNISASHDLLGYHQKEKSWYSNAMEKPASVTTSKDHMDLRNWQVNQPLFDGRGKWKKILSEEELQSFENSDAHQLMKQFEYLT